MLFMYPLHNSLTRSCAMALLCFVWSLGLQSVNSQQILRPHTQLCSKSLQVIKQQLVPQLWPCHTHTHTSQCVWREHVWGTCTLQNGYCNMLHEFSTRDFPQNGEKGSLFQLCIEQSFLVYFACASRKRVNVNLKKFLSPQRRWPLWWYEVVTETRATRHDKYYGLSIYICTCIQCMY